MAKGIKRILDILLYGYNYFVFWLIKLDDAQKRQAQVKREAIESESLSGKFQKLGWKISYYLTPKRFSLSEQKDLVEMLRLSIKFKNSITQPFEFMIQRKDLRPFVRLTCQQVLEDLKTKSLNDCLRGKKVLDNEYVELIKIAEEVGNFIETYTLIIDSIVEKKKRRKAFFFLMFQPILTLAGAIIAELSIALWLIPQLLETMDVEELQGTVLSYYNLREILLYHKLEYGLKALAIIVFLVFFVRLPATKYLMHVLLMQVPFISKYIAQWEISKFFSAINDMLKASASMQTATKTALDLVTNIAVKNSLAKDLREQGSKTNDLGTILSNSVYVDLKVRNQLRVSANSGGTTTELLESIAEEYKDSMNTLMSTPAQLVIPMMLGVSVLYIFMRLVPLFTDVSTMMQNIR